MDPLSAYLLSVLKNEKTCDSRAYLSHSEALEELGYWLMQRPRNCPREKMPPCKLTQECQLIDEFPSHVSVVRVDDRLYEGFDIMVDVYADPFVVEKVT